jgi:hypothetical protein
MRIVAASYGSAGDFVPTVAVAVALARRGHDVRLFANPTYAAALAGSGLDFRPAGEPHDLPAAVRQDPTLLDPAKGGRRLVTDWLLPDIRATCTAIRDDLAQRPADLALCANTSFGCWWAAAEHGVPHVTVAASPLVWLNPRAPMPLTPWALPALVDGLLMRAVRTLVGVGLGWALRRTARALGVRGVDTGYRGPERNPVLNAGMWSPEVRPSAPGDPPASAVCGTARASAWAGGGAELSNDLRAFLDAGAAPVVIALGSVFSQGSATLLHQVAQAVLACAARAVVVGHLPGPQPSGVHVVSSAPYNALFARAAAVVVHGGAGSTAEALRSGKPVAVIPFGFDQYAMARVVERLGCGLWIPGRERDASGLTLALRRLLGDERFAHAASAVGARSSAERDGAEVAADIIEARMAKGRVSPAGGN